MVTKKATQNKNKSIDSWAKLHVKTSCEDLDLIAQETPSTRIFYQDCCRTDQFGGNSHHILWFDEEAMKEWQQEKLADMQKKALKIGIEPNKVKPKRAVITTLSKPSCLKAIKRIQALGLFSFKRIMISVGNSTQGRLAGWKVTNLHGYYSSHFNMSIEELEYRTLLLSLEKGKKNFDVGVKEIDSGVNPINEAENQLTEYKTDLQGVNSFNTYRGESFTSEHCQDFQPDSITTFSTTPQRPLKREMRRSRDENFSESPNASLEVSLSDFASQEEENKGNPELHQDSSLVEEVKEEDETTDSELNLYAIPEDKTGLVRIDQIKLFLNDVVLERPNDGSSTENPLREVISTVELTQEELELEAIEMEKIVGKGFLRAREVEFMTGLQQTAYFNKYGGLGSYKKLRQEKWYKMTIEQQEAQWKVLPQQQKLSDCHQKSD